MATVYWSPNGQATSQVDTLTVGGTPAAGNTISAVINTKTVTYTLVSGDTTTTAASGLLALLTNQATAPPEFNEITWTSSAAVITGTATTAGTPFTLTASATGGGATITHATATANSSPSDVNNANNWLRGGSAALPQNGDDMIVADSAVPLLWNLSSLSAITLASYTRWQSFTGTIGLPEWNPNGYVEYRPTYFEFAGPVGALPMILGYGSGSGPNRERYNVGSQNTALVVLASGSAIDDYAVRFLGTNASNTIQVTGTSVGVAMLPSEVADLTSGTVNVGGTLDLGAGVTISGALSVKGGASTISCAPGSFLIQNGGTGTVALTGLTIATVTVQGGSTLDYLAGGTITTLSLLLGSTLDKSQDIRALTITNATIDGDTCQVLDPNGVITWTNAATVNGQVASGPFQTSPGRSWKIT